MPSEDRVRKGADKLQKFLNTKQQGRLDTFFTVKPKTSPKKDKGKEKKADAKGTKRKVRFSFDYYWEDSTGFVQSDDKKEGGSKKAKTKK